MKERAVTGGSFKKPGWRTTNRMLFESGYRTFDRAVDYISRGNVVSNVQLSAHIRKASDLNDHPRGIKPGECRAADLAVFRHRGIPEPISDFIRKRPEEEFWLYCWHFPGRRLEYGAAVGWILTDGAMARSLVRVSGGQRKAYLALHEAEKYVVKGDWT